MKRAIELELLEKKGEVKNVQRQIKYELQPAFVNSKGDKVRAIHYVADFVYEKNGITIVEDVKSFMTIKLPEYVIKKKLFQYKYPQYEFFENLMK